MSCGDQNAARHVAPPIGGPAGGWRNRHRSNARRSFSAILESGIPGRAGTTAPGDGQPATFVTSFNAADVAAYRIVGTKGHLHADPAYEYAEGLEYTLTIDGKTRKKRAGKRDQFAPELLYFSDCI
jgi:hypothetical protein